MTKYDDATWHGGSGDIDNSGAIYIGLYLAWLAERDLLNPEVLDPDSSMAIESRSISLGDLADVFDGKLVSAMLSPAGDQFTASFYRREYLAIWDRLEGASPDPATGDGWAAYDTLVPAIDSRYRDWMASPRPSENQEWPAEPQPDQSPRNDQISTQVIAPAVAQGRGHEDPDLERRLAKVTTAEHINSIVGVKEPRPPVGTPAHCGPAPGSRDECLRTRNHRGWRGHADGCSSTGPRRRNDEIRSSRHRLHRARYFMGPENDRRAPDRMG